MVPDGTQRADVSVELAWGSGCASGWWILSGTSGRKDYLKSPLDWRYGCEQLTVIFRGLGKYGGGNVEWEVGNGEWRVMKRDWWVVYGE